MRKGVDFYNLLMDASGGVWQAAGALQPVDANTEEPPLLLQLRRGRAESPAWFLVQAEEFDPRPLSVEALRVRDVYAAPRLVAALLALMASEGWLAPGDDGDYYLTDEGRDMLAQMRMRRDRLLARVEAETDFNLQRLARLLRRLLAASFEAGHPPGSWCLRHSRRRAPGDDAGLLAHIEHYFADFNAFRDDAHMAAWQRHGIGGHAWEAFTLIWKGEAETAAEIARRLYFRGYFEPEYAQALEALEGRGWLQRDGNRYQLTGVGRQVREAAERLTDAYFYQPWTALDEGEIEELAGLLEALRDGALLAETAAAE